MEVIDTIVRHLLEHPRRKSFVMASTFLVALLAVWPAVDSYLALCEFNEDLLVQIEEARAQSVGLDHLSEIASRRAAELDEWENRIVTEDDTHEFRNLIVGLARANGCRVRRVDVGISTQIKWALEEGSTVGNTRNTASKDSPFELRKQTVHVTIAGNLTTILAFLGELDADDRIKEHHSLLVRPAGDGGQVVVDLELILMEPKRISAAAA